MPANKLQFGIFYSTMQYSSCIHHGISVYFTKNAKFGKFALYNFSLIKYNAAIKKPTKKGTIIMKKIFALALAALLLISCFAGCAQNNASDLTYVKEKGKLIVGMTEYKPMDFKDANGQWTGFDAEFARLFAQELGVDIEFLVLADWGQKIYELETKNIDVIWNGMTITDEILNNTNCSKPYVLNKQVLVMKSDVAANYTTTDSIKSLSICVELGSSAEGALKGINITNYTTMQDQTSCLMEVAAGTSNACVVDSTLAEAMTGAGTNYENLTVAMELTNEEYGVAFRKGSDITAKFNEFMAKLMSDGTLDALAEKYKLVLIKE